jgi:hypothetical protein
MIWMVAFSTDSVGSEVAARVAISEKMVWLAVGAYILYSPAKNEADVTRISADIATSLL